MGTAFAKCALERGEGLVFYDFQPRGDYLTRKLGKADVVTVQHDVRDLPALIQVIKEHQVDTVVHTAGLIGNRVVESLYTGMQINVMGTLNVAEAVRLTGIKRLVHISTHGVYDRRCEGSTPLTEDFPRGGGSGYGNSKAAKELILEAYQRQYGFKLVSLRLAGVYGLGHFWSGSGGGRMVQSIVHGGLTGEVVHLAKGQTRDFEYIYSKDVGRAIDLAATLPSPGKTFFNIGTGVITKFDHLKKTAEILLPKLKFEITSGKAPTTGQQPMDISQAKKYLGWEPIFDMEAGLKDLTHDLLSSYDYEIK